MRTPLDSLWVIGCASLVFLMQAGFMCLEAGSTRRKNNINVAIKNIADLSISIIIFWAFGYGLMFGQSHAGWLGLDRFFPEVGLTENWFVIFFLFQAVFCSTAVTILSGAIAERMKFRGYLILSIIISGLIYPIFGHWVWHGLNESVATGWLGQKGFIDFAGSTVVHSLGGWASLAAILVIGPRTGRFSQKRRRTGMTSSDIPLAFLGTLLLWFGWFGFNGGSTLAFTPQIAGIIVNTLFAGAAGLITPLIWMLCRQQEVSVSLVMNGALAGLVAITANCHAVSSKSALCIGVIGGLVMMLMDYWLERWQIDDAVGAIPVHLGGGIWGTIAVALFGDLDRLGTNLTRIQQLEAQFSGVLTCALWTFPIVLILLSLLDGVMPLRVSRRQEYIGLNVAEHGAQSEFQDLYETMKSHIKTGKLSRRAPKDAFTEVGQISGWYNQVVQALEHAIQRTDAIVETAVDGILTVQPYNLTIRTANPAINTIFGYSESELRNLPMSHLMRIDLQQEQEILKQPEDLVAAMIYQLLENGCQTGAFLHAVGLHRQGRIFPIELTATESIVGSEKFWTVMIRDVSERRAAELALQKSEAAARENAVQLKQAIAQLQQAQAQLLQSEKMNSLGHLVAGITHEINNPVGFIYSNLAHARNYVQDLLQAIDYYKAHTQVSTPELQAQIDELDLDFVREDFPRLISSMHNGSERIRDIVVSLRNFARFDEADWKRVDLHEGIDSTLTMLSHQLNATHDRLAIRVEKVYGDLPEVECYAGGLNQVFLNLLSNAIEAIDQTAKAASPGKITVTTMAQAKQIIIAIADNGPGIDNAVQQKMFDPFFTTKPVGDGTGMGLAISHQIIVDQHGGQLGCDSVVGRGTTFRLVLPLQPGHAMGVVS